LQCVGNQGRKIAAEVTDTCNLKEPSKI